MPRSLLKRRVCFVTGTRAEFGLMRTALEAIAAHPKLQLQILATGMHLDPRHGRSIDQIEKEGFRVDHVTPWSVDVDKEKGVARGVATGEAIADISKGLDRLKSDIVLVVGDRVEAFAGAAAGHLTNKMVAHVHGGDRALGQIDDSLRHAITKLAHIHFPATRASAKRILRLGEQPERVFNVGSPGNDQIKELAASWVEVERLFPGLAPFRYALLLLHPASPDEQQEYQRAQLVIDSTRRAGFESVVVLFPNNDPGAAGIIRRIEEQVESNALRVVKDLPRAEFLGLMRDCAALVGNSSSGIIEAASFGVSVVDIGPRQSGRERSRNVEHCDYNARQIRTALGKIWNKGHSKRVKCRNVYGGVGAGKAMADILARVAIDPVMLGKLIRY